MKKFAIAIVCLLLAIGGYAQDKKGFVGLSIGPSFPVGKFAKDKNNEEGYDIKQASVGVQMNAANFGYNFTNNFGVAASIYGSINEMDNFSDDTYFLYGGLLAGPMLTLPIGGRVKWDFRPMVGFMGAGIYDYYDWDYGSGSHHRWGYDHVKSDVSFCYNLGTTIRVDVAKFISVLMNVDYLTSTNTAYKFDKYNNSTDRLERYKVKQNISTVSLTFGAAFRF